jgi:hypothetical protein
MQNMGAQTPGDDLIIKSMFGGVHVLDHYFFGLITVDLDLIQDLEITIIDEHGQVIETIPEAKGFSALSESKPIFYYSSDYRRRFACVPLPAGGYISISGDISGYFRDFHSRVAISFLIFLLCAFVFLPIWWWLTSRALNNCEIIEKQRR